MKLKLILLLLVSWVAFYLIGAFVSLDPNPLLWLPGSRAVYVLLGIVANLFTVVVYLGY